MTPFTARCCTDVVQMLYRSIVPIHFLQCRPNKKKHKDLSWNLKNNLPKRMAATTGKAMCEYWQRVLGYFWNFINIFKKIFDSLWCYGSVGFSNMATITSNLTIYLNYKNKFLLPFLRVTPFLSLQLLHILILTRKVKISWTKKQVFNFSHRSAHKIVICSQF